MVARNPKLEVRRDPSGMLYEILRDLCAEKITSGLFEQR